MSKKTSPKKAESSVVKKSKVKVKKNQNLKSNEKPNIKPDKPSFTSRLANQVRGVRVVYSIRGLNLDHFINLLKNRDIPLYDLKKVSNKQLIVTVSLIDSKKLFAFAKEMCYNIEKVKEKGVGYPLLKALRSTGIVFGCLVFMIIATLLSDVVYQISFSGTGSVLKREVYEYLDSVGVKEGSRFSQIDYQKLEDQILADNNHLSFVSIEKHGNTLMVDLALANSQVDRLNNKIYSLLSTTDGVVESIKVYRGTPQVKVGDKVDNGCLLVDGYMVIKDKTVKINVLASVSIINEQKFIYVDNTSDAEDKAILLAEAHFSDSEIVALSVEKYGKDKEFIYEVSVKRRIIIHAG